MKQVNAAIVVFCVVAVSCSAGAKISGGQKTRGAVSGTGQDHDGFSLLTQLHQVVTARASASIHHAATPEFLSNMLTMASSLARMSNTSTADSPFASITDSMKATISNILHVRVNVDYISLGTKMAAFRELFGACEKNREAGKQKGKGKQEEIPALAKSHATCRAEEAVKYSDKNACNSSLQTSRLVQSTGCDIVIKYGQDESTSLCASRLSETAEQYNRRMISEFKSRLDTIRLQKSLCQNASFAVDSQQNACEQEERDLRQKRATCNRIQETLDSKACDVGRMMNTTCQAYHACRGQTMYSFSLAENTTEASSQSLRKEYGTLKRVECLLDNLGGTQASLDECMNQEVDSSHLAVNKMQPDPCQACEMLAEQPGTPEYEQEVFGNLSADAPATPCTASCCIDF